MAPQLGRRDARLGRMVEICPMRQHIIYHGTHENMSESTSNTGEWLFGIKELYETECNEQPQ